MRGIDAGLADPADFGFDECAKKFLGLAEIRGDVVVHEEEEFSVTFYGSDFRQDIVHGAAGLGGAKNGLDGAELAFEMAAAPGLDQSDG